MSTPKVAPRRAKVHAPPTTAPLGTLGTDVLLFAGTSDVPNMRRCVSLGFDPDGTPRIWVRRGWMNRAGALVPRGRDAVSLSLSELDDICAKLRSIVTADVSAERAA